MRLVTSIAFGHNPKSVFIHLHSPTIYHIFYPHPFRFVSLPYSIMFHHQNSVYSARFPLYELRN